MLLLNSPLIIIQVTHNFAGILACRVFIGLPEVHYNLPTKIRPHASNTRLRSILERFIYSQGGTLERSVLLIIACEMALSKSLGTRVPFSDLVRRATHFQRIWERESMLLLMPTVSRWPHCVLAYGCWHPFRDGRQERNQGMEMVSNSLGRFVYVHRHWYMFSRLFFIEVWYATPPISVCQVIVLHRAR